AGKVAAGEVRAAIDLVGTQHAAVVAVDDHQRAVVVAVAIIRVANVERLVGAGPVVVGALAGGQPLDHPVGVVVAGPDPGLHAAVVEAVVRRRLAEGIAHGPGAVGIGIALAPVEDAGDARRRRGRKGARRRSIGAGRGG